ncbi:hypothetical protein WAX46_14660 [Bacillus sp. FJAT-53060]|uniref:hypothetical protein n=1 Tax=Bacillus TaxID=1386 RepID=UPI001CFC34DA|nr:hypothetical protein [Bacillus stratosphericus]
MKENDEKYALARWHLDHRDVQEATKHLQELTDAEFEHANQAAYDLSLQLTMTNGMKLYVYGKIYLNQTIFK